MYLSSYLSVYIFAYISIYLSIYLLFYFSLSLSLSFSLTQTHSIKYLFLWPAEPELSAEGSSSPFQRSQSPPLPRQTEYILEDYSINYLYFGQHQYLFCIQAYYLQTYGWFLKLTQHSLHYFREEESNSRLFLFVLKSIRASPSHHIVRYHHFVPGMKS